MNIDRTTYRNTCNVSPRTESIRMVVLHATAGRRKGDIQTLTACGGAKPVSVHYYIPKTGEIFQMVDEDLVAWHAGESAWKDVHDCNSISVGIELENLNTGSDPYPKIQYQAAVELTRDIVARYSIPREWLVRHLDISPGRKTDPAGFPWAKFVADVYRPLDLEVPPGIDPAFVASWLRSGGAWRPNELTPGLPLHPAHISEGQLVQWFERSVAKTSDGGRTVQWALISEFAGLQQPDTKT